MPQPTVGSVFAGHFLEGLVGRGGMGVVYRARQLDLGRVVALKVIASDLLEDAHARERFLQEARAAASIDHPNVIPVFSAGEDEGVAYLTMRHVDGDDVRTLVRRAGALEPARAAAIAAQVGTALDAIHAAGLVHRDVKPANVLLGANDHVYLTDFGLAKSALSRGSQTSSGHWVGTLDYVAPEQIRGEHADARADVYALGGVLHYMLCARVPFTRDGDEAKLWAHLSDSPPRPSQCGAPDAFDAVVIRAMAKAPEDRYPSAGDLGRAALAAARGGQPSEPERTVARGGAAPRPPETRTRRRSASASSGSAAAAGHDARGPRRLTGAGIAGLVLIAAVLAGTVLLGDGTPSGPGTRDGVPADASPDRTDYRVAATYHDVGERPNGVVISEDRAWVTSFVSRDLIAVDIATSEVADRVRIGVGASDIVADGPEIWVALTRSNRIVRVDASTGRLRQAIDISKPNSIALTERFVWVGSRSATRGEADSLVRFDRRTGARTGEQTVAAGISVLAATGSAVWIGHRRVDRVSRLDLQTGDFQQLPRSLGGGRLVDLAVGEGYVWTSNEDGVLGRIEPREERVATIATGGRAGQIALGGGRVWVALVDAHEVASIDVETSRSTGRNLPVGLNPYGLAAEGGSVYVTSRGDATLTRITR